MGECAVAPVGFLMGEELEGGAALSNARLRIARATSASLSPGLPGEFFIAPSPTACLVRQARLGATTCSSAPPIRDFR
jgi:hypothetical protein